MENFVVSARKYRPVNFEEVVGQEHITTTLNNAIENNHLAQALLFCGPRGVGKTTCARILARLINNFEDKGEEGNSTALNIYELDAASNNSVEDIRNLIDQVRYPPQFGKYKVYIIDEVHMLSSSAFNAFLKTLEEPPPYAIFILATTEKHKVLPTILSRCQIFDFNRIGVSDISNHLQIIADKEKVSADAEALHLIAQKADGALRDALSLFDLMVTYSSDNKISYQDVVANLHILDYDYYFQITDDLISSNVSGVLVAFDEILKKGFDEHNFILGLTEHFRNLIMARDKDTSVLLDVTEKLAETYRSQGKKADQSFLMTAIHLGNQCDLNFKSAKNHRLHVEVALMKMAHIPYLIQGEALNEEASKKKSPQLESVITSETIGVSEEKPESLQKELVDTDLKEEPKEKEAVKEIEVEKEGSPGSDAANEKAEESLEVPVSKAKTPIKAKIKTIVNLNDFSKQSEKEEEEDTLDFEDESFDKNDLQKALNKYADSLEKNKKIGEAKLLRRDFEYEKGKIFIVVDSPVDESRYNDIKSDLLLFIRKSVKNKSLQMDLKRIELEKIKTVYTPQEKFDYLSQKNPALIELKKRLGLEFEF